MLRHRHLWFVTGQSLYSHRSHQKIPYPDYRVHYFLLLPSRAHTYQLLRYLQAFGANPRLYRLVVFKTLHDLSLLVWLRDGLVCHSEALLLHLRVLFEFD